MDPKIDSVIDIAKVCWSAGEGGDFALTRVSDSVAVEEPLEIALCWEPEQGAVRREVFTVTMRTPGHDRELALGLLHGEGLVRTPGQVSGCEHQGEIGPGRFNQLEVRLAGSPNLVLDHLQRHLVTQSSCGVCGKTSLQALEMKSPPPLDAREGWLDPAVLAGLGPAMRQRQERYLQTGGLHAAGLFSAAGQLLLLREDVGRHNALDKLVGAHLYGDAGATDDPRRVLLLSGRVSFELVQKAVMAALPVVAAVGAPSSLAISLARRFDLTLIGFLGEGSFNVYSGQQRLLRS